MDGKRRAGRGEGRERFARGMREARPEMRVSTTLCADFRDGQFALQSRGCGGERRHAGRQRIGDAAPCSRRNCSASA